MVSFGKNYNSIIILNSNSLISINIQIPIAIVS